MLPAGQVTFFFSDVEGSTELLRRLGPGYPKALEAHRQVIREALKRHGGVEIGTEGDGMFAAFVSATSAARAANEVHAGLSQIIVDDEACIRVRIGIHTGEAWPSNGEYSALAVNQAARVMRAAHGGQTLLSETAANLVARGPDSGCSISDLGLYRIRDFDVPVRLFQAMPLGTSPRFPHPKAPSASVTNLPRPRTSFIGRQALLEELQTLATSCSLITLLGPGGVGKTRTAIEVGRLSIPHFPDGVWLMPLADRTADDPLLQLLGELFGVVEDPSRDPADVISDRLSQKALLIIDNCEHIIDNAAQMIDKLLQHCPELSIIATSREILNVHDETVVRVPPLQVPSPDDATDSSEAFVLFAERASVADRNFDVEDAAPAIRKIVHNLDGIPLAIELAAARMREISAQELVSDLGEGIRALGKGPRTAEGRHMTLERTIQWSYELLNDQEAMFLRGMSIFPETFDHESAQYLFQELSPESIRDLLQTSEDRSLIVRTAEPNVYRMLATIKDFLVRRLDASDERDLVRQGFKRWAIAVSEEMIAAQGSDRRADLGFLRHLAGLQQAFIYLRSEGSPLERVMVGLGIVALLDIHDRNQEMKQVLEEIVDLAEGDHSLRILAVTKLAAIHWSMEDVHRARELAEYGLRIARSKSDRVLEARNLNTLGAIERTFGRYVEARRLFEDAIEAARAGGSRYIEAFCLNHLGLVHRFTGDFASAMIRYSELIQIGEELQDSSLLAMAHVRLSGVRYAQGDLEGTIASASEGLLYSRIALTKTLQVNALLNLAYAYAGSEQLSKAREALFQAESISHELGGFCTYDVKAMTAMCERVQGNFKLAAQTLREAITLGMEGRNPSMPLLALQEAAMFAHSLGRRDVSQPLAFSITALYHEGNRVIDRPDQQNLEMMLRGVEHRGDPMSLQAMVSLALGFLNDYLVTDSSLTDQSQ